MRRIPDNDLRPGLEDHATDGIVPVATRRSATNGFAPVAAPTAEEISELIQEREYAMKLLPEGQVRHAIRTEIEQLRRRVGMARMTAAGANMTTNAQSNEADTISSAP